MPKPVTPLLTVDVIIELLDQPGHIVLIERRNEPLGWALPGGFVDVGETVEQAAVREAFEETGLQVTLRALLGVYSDPSRDPRGHTCGIVFIGTAQGRPVAGDDARNVRAVATGADIEMAFDHAAMLRDYQRFLASGDVRAPSAC